jgi:hypothetical protein
LVILRKNLENSFFGFFIFACILEVNSLRGTPFSVGDYDFSYAEFVIGAAFILAIALLISRKKLSRRLSIIGVIFLCVVVLRIIWEFYFPSQEMVIPINGSWDLLLMGREQKTAAELSVQSILRLARLIILFTFLLALDSHPKKMMFVTICRAMVTFTKINVIFGLFELISKNVFQSNMAYTISNIFLGADKGVNSLIIRGDSYALQGLTYEPSHFAMTLFFFVIVLILLKSFGFKKRGDLLWIIAGCILMVVSTALSSIVFIIVIILVIAYLSKNNKVIQRGILLTVALGLVVVVVFVTNATIFQGSLTDSYFLRRMDNLFNCLPYIWQGDYSYAYQISTESGLPRIISAVDCFKLFLRHPLFGLGIGMTAAHSGTISALVSLGIVGFCFWFRILFVDFLYEFNKRGYLTLCVIIFIVGMLLVGDAGFMHWTFSIPIIGLIKMAYRKEEVYD